MRDLLIGALLLAAPGVCFAQAVAPQSPAAVEPERPSLVLTIVVDQFSANLFNQYRDRFTGGLATLTREGLVHANGYQTHGLTETCPGHSTVLTGMHPTHTGIPANDWVDPATGKEVYCLAEPANHLAHGDDSTDNGPVGPRQLGVTTLADWLKTVSPQSRVFAVSGKDRGAINLNGHLGDGAYWFTETPGFGLTTYVEPGQSAEERLRPVAAFNETVRPRIARSTWDYNHDQCRALAADWPMLGGVFHSTLPREDQRYDNTPILDEVTVDAALYLLETQQLGRRGVTDMLGVSLSGTDRVGHGNGTQGPEMCEQMYRLDAALGRLLDAVKQVPGGAVVVLTADHGGSDFPERTAVRGFPDAHRITGAFYREMAEAMEARFGLGYVPIHSGSSGLIVGDDDEKALPDPLRGQIADAAVEFLNAHPEHVALAVRREEIFAMPLPDSSDPDLLTVRERLRLSAVEGRSPDVFVAWQPGVLSGGSLGGTISSHGTVWDYDRRVPILFWWPGAQGQERFLPIRTVDIAPTLANVIGVEAPEGLDGRCMDLGAPGAGACPR